jgi:phospholipase/carboxylesterase
MSTPSDIEFLPADGPAQQLFILLHEEHGSPQTMRGLADALRQAFPQSAILVPAGFEPADRPADGGRQWFSTRGLDDDSRPDRVAQAMPSLVRYIRAAQARFHLLQTDTALAGFSQGAIMALAIVQANDGLAGRVLSFSGRYATMPHSAPQYTTIHLLHGADDAVMPVTHSQNAQARLNALHGDSTIDVATRVGHELHPALIQRAVVRLQTCVPLRSWEAALGLNQSAPHGSLLH